MILKRFFSKLLLLLLTFSFLNANEYKVVTENFAPFAYIENDEVKGLSIEIVEALLEKLNVDTEIEIKPWSRAYNQTLMGTNGVLFSVARTEQRENLFKWVGPLVSDSVDFYKSKVSKIEVESLEDAKKLNSILVVNSYPEEKHLKNLGFNNLYGATFPSQALLMLVYGRGDLMPVGKLALPGLLKKTKVNASLIEKTNIQLYKVDLYIAFSKAISDEKIKLWQDALDELKKSNRYDDILKKYIIE